MTIKDLAERTGYAVGTVSRVLNNHPNVSEQARKTILKAVEESGFQLNVNAKHLKQQHATSILLVVKGTANELFSGLVERIQSLIAQTQYPLLVDYIDEDSNEVLRAIQLLREKKPLGILFLGGNSLFFRQDFHKISVPCVLVTNDASQLRFPNLSSVALDDRQAAACAVESLIRLGHREFVVVGGCVASDTGRLRYQGCLDAFAKHGIAFDPDKRFRGVRFSYQDGYEVTRDLIRSGQTFTALVAASDVMAIGAIRALWEEGRRVPEDVSVVGFDGLPLGQYLVPQLSTVAQPVEMLAKTGVELLIRCIENQEQAHYETVPFQLHQRGSCRKIG